MNAFLAPVAVTATEHFIPGVKSHYPKYASKGARVLGMDINTMAKFYDTPVPAWNQFIDEQFITSTKSKWINRTFKNMREAREFCKTFGIPADIKHDAQVLSRELVRDLIQSGGMPRVLRNQTRGRFDAAKMPRIITDLHKGTFSIDNTRPFKARERVAPSRPHVGICANSYVAPVLGG